MAFVSVLIVHNGDFKFGGRNLLETVVP